jgi:hypothetical protein
MGTRTPAENAVAATIVLKSTDGGQTCQDIREGLSGKLGEGGFSVSRKIRICQVFYWQDPGRHKVFLLHQL